MDGRFDPRLSSIFVYGEIVGPSGTTRVKLAVDTGSTRTVIRKSILVYVGYVIPPTVGNVRLTTASGTCGVSLVNVMSLSALDRTMPLRVVAHELPDTFEGHGLLGRDFYADRVLAINFRSHTITLRPPSPPHPRWQFWR